MSYALCRQIEARNAYSGIAEASVSREERNDCRSSINTSNRADSNGCEYYIEINSFPRAEGYKLTKVTYANLPEHRNVLQSPDEHVRNSLDCTLSGKRA